MKTVSAAEFLAALREAQASIDSALRVFKQRTGKLVAAVYVSSVAVSSGDEEPRVEQRSVVDPAMNDAEVHLLPPAVFGLSTPPSPPSES